MYQLITETALQQESAVFYAIAGRCVYGEEPHDVYRRHDNCGCSVIYENGRKRQDVWSKRTWKKPKVGAGAPTPTKLTPEQARMIEQEKLTQIRGLKSNISSIDIPVENDIIESRDPATKQEIADFKASLLEMGFTDITGFEAVEDLQPKKQVKRQFEDSFGRYYTKKQADKWITKGLSIYATEFDYRDFIAESFAEYYISSDPRSLCTAVDDNILKMR